MSTDSIGIIATLVLLFSVVGTKTLTTHLIHAIQHNNNRVSHLKQEALNEFRMAKAQRGAAEGNKTNLLRKKVKLQKKINRLKRELKTIEEYAKHRHQLMRTTRGPLTRSTQAIIEV